MDDVINSLKQLEIHQNMSHNESFVSDQLKLVENIFTHSETNLNGTLEVNPEILFRNWTSQYYMHSDDRPSQWKIIVIFLYSLIIFMSIFGNSIVCKIVFWNSAMRSTTNIFIGNLSVSDLLMTLLNIPLQLTQILCRNWPLNQFLCRCLPFFQGLSVNVSSFTMAFIALDRYQVIAYPLKPRPGMTSIILRIILIWIMASIASSPYPAIAGIEEDFTFEKITRCRLIYPEPKYEVRQSFTVVITAVQYLIPMSITGVTYFKICYIIWHRRTIGVISDSQRNRRHIAKWKTIKMLVIVFLVFVICWLPLNMYHIYQDFRSNVGPHKHNPVIFLVCHWFAMSSICYNPFLYCWLNERFRTMAKSYVLFFLRIRPNLSTESFNLYRKRRFAKHKNKHPSKILTLSESLNTPNPSGKAELTHHQSTKREPGDLRSSSNKRNSTDTVKFKMNTMLNYMTRNSSKSEENLDLERVDFLKETVV